ncbi:MULTISPECIES: hypothetical protein [Ahrensia]|uniref:Uncharacterized protein n=1 Tax=Ahrensia kielensis TaxID=76980 RepID=A0ABU9T9K5_9HYPH|nr:MULTISPECIES: hypothetical protein [Ahrensia]
MANKNSDKERRRESDRILNSVNTNSEVVGTSSLVRTANKTRDHLLGADADQEDKIEVWGKRIGRGLSIVVFIALAIWLLNFLSRGAA